MGIMKRVLNIIIILVTAVVMVALMQLSLLFLKDKISTIFIEKGEYILEMLNRFERETLLSERDSLLRLLDNLISDKSKTTNTDRIKIREIDTKIDDVNKKLSETNQRIEQNVSEENKIQSAKKEDFQEKESNFIEDLFKKNQENLALKIKVEVTDQKLKEETEKTEETNKVLKDKLINIYKDNPKMISAIESAFTGKKETEIILAELNKIDRIVNFNKENINAVKEDFPELLSNEDFISTLKTTETTSPIETIKEDLSGIIASMERIMDRNYRTNTPLYSDYLSSKKRYEADNNQASYVSILTEIIRKCSDADKVAITEKEAKIIKHSSTIMKLVKLLDEKDKKIE